MSEKASFPFRHDRRYAGLACEQIPLSDSLHDTVKRVRLAWDDSIANALRANRRVPVAGNSNYLRGLIKLMENVPDEDIVMLKCQMQQLSCTPLTQN